MISMLTPQFHQRSAEPKLKHTARLWAWPHHAQGRDVWTVLEPTPIYINAQIEKFEETNGKFQKTS